MSQKLDIGATLSRVFDLYREQAGVLLPAAAVIFLIPAAAAAAVGTNPASPELALLLLVVAVVASYWYQGLVVEAVRDIEEDGRRDFSVGDLFRSAAPFVGPLLLAGILAGIGIAIGLILLIVPGLVLLTWWSLLAPVIVLERASIGAAFGRSRSLVRGNGWQVFAVLVVLAIVQALVASLLREAALAISDARVSEAIGGYVGNVLIAPLTALAATVVYLRLRAMRGQSSLGAGGAAGVRGAEPGAAGTADVGLGAARPAGPPTGGAALPGGEDSHRGWAPPRAPDDPAGRP